MYGSIFLYKNNAVIYIVFPFILSRRSHRKNKKLPRLHTVWVMVDAAPMVVWWFLTLVSSLNPPGNGLHIPSSDGIELKLFNVSLLFAKLVGYVFLFPYKG